MFANKSLLLSKIKRNEGSLNTFAQYCISHKLQAKEQFQKPEHESFLNISVSVKCCSPHPQDKCEQFHYNCSVLISTVYSIGSWMTRSETKFIGKTRKQ